MEASGQRRDGFAIVPLGLVDSTVELLKDRPWLEVDHVLSGLKGVMVMSLEELQVALAERGKEEEKPDAPSSRRRAK